RPDEPPRLRTPVRRQGIVAERAVEIFEAAAGAVRPDAGEAMLELRLPGRRIAKDARGLEVKREEHARREVLRELRLASTGDGAEEPDERRGPEIGADVEGR